MQITFLGAEDQADRELLLECGVLDIGVNFFDLGAQQRTALLKVPDDVRIHLYAGNPPSQVSDTQIHDLVEAYESYVEQHADRLYSWSEVRAPGVDVANRRKEFYDRFDAFRFRPVHNEANSMFDLEGLADAYPHVLLTREAVSVLRESLDHDKSEDPLLALSVEYGAVFHAMGMHRAKRRHYNFATVATAMWQAPRRFGQPVIWDGKKLTRHTVDVREEVLDKHYARIKAYGLSADDIVGGDKKEGMRLAVISMLEYQKACERTPGLEASIPVEFNQTAPLEEVSDSSAVAESPETPGTVVALPVSSTNPGGTDAGRSKGHYPFLTTEKMSSVVAGENGHTVEEIPLIATTSGVRHCDICVLSRQCPAFDPGAECSFGIPVELRTREQLMALLRATMEIQSSRVFFSRFQEELAGGNLDETTSKEIDRLFRLANQLKVMDEVKDTLSVTVERKSSAGVLSAIFGKGSADELLSGNDPEAR